MTTGRSIEEAYKTENLKFAFMIICVTTLIEMVILLSVSSIAMANHTRLTPMLPMLPGLFLPLLMVPVTQIILRKPTQEMREHYLRTGCLPENATFRPALRSVLICALLGNVILVVGFFYTQVQHPRNWPG